MGDVVADLDLQGLQPFRLDRPQILGRQRPAGLGHRLHQIPRQGPAIEFPRRPADPGNHRSQVELLEILAFRHRPPLREEQAPGAGIVGQNLGGAVEIGGEGPRHRHSQAGQLFRFVQQAFPPHFAIFGV